MQKQNKAKKETVNLKKLKRGDEVVVIAGKDKGKRGSILKVLPNGKLLVSGVQTVIKHVKANPHKEIAAARKTIEAPIHHSNVALFNEATGTGDRVVMKRLEDGTKVRCFKSNGEVIDS